MTQVHMDLSLGTEFRKGGWIWQVPPPSQTQSTTASPCYPVSPPIPPSLHLVPSLTWVCVGSHPLPCWHSNCTWLCIQLERIYNSHKSLVPPADLPSKIGLYNYSIMSKSKLSLAAKQNVQSEIMLKCSVWNFAYMLKIIHTCSELMFSFSFFFFFF